VVITQPDSLPNDLRRFEAKIDGPLWLDVIDALPKMLAEPLAASVKSSEPSNSAIKQTHCQRWRGRGGFGQTRLPSANRIVGSSIRLLQAASASAGLLLCLKNRL
jgi:hypothetical protein